MLKHEWIVQKFGAWPLRLLGMQELCGRCDNEIRAAAYTLLAKKRPEGTGTETSLSVCPRCYFGCEIRRLSAAPFFGPGEVIAVESLRTTYELLTDLRNASNEAKAAASSSSPKGDEGEAKGSGESDSSAETPAPKRKRQR